MEILERYSFGRYSMYSVQERERYICTYINSANLPTEDLVFTEDDLNACVHYEFIPATIGAVLTRDASDATSRLVPDKVEYMKPNKFDLDWVGMLSDDEIDEIKKYGGELEVPHYEFGVSWDTQFRIQVLEVL